MNQIVLTLLEAVVTLYPADASGAPILSSPIWTGAKVENLQVAARWLTVKTRPSGARYPVNHPLVPEYQIHLDRVWLLNLSDLLGFAPTWKNYVLDVVWTEEESQDWHRRVFYGVTISDTTLANRDFDAGFTDNQSFEAQYHTASSGLGTVEAISAALPYRVFWEGSDGQFLLYDYNAATHQFTAAATTTGRAVIGYDAGIFSILFAGDTEPVLKTITSTALNYRSATLYRNSAPYRCGLAGLVVRALLRGVPLPTDLPRLDFYYGATRVCSVTRRGLYEPRFAEVLPVNAAGMFALFADTELEATLGAQGVDARAFWVPA